MTEHGSHSATFKRQVAQEFVADETLHSLSQRHDNSRQLMRVRSPLDRTAKLAAIWAILPTHTSCGHPEVPPPDLAQLAREPDTRQRRFDYVRDRDKLARRRPASSFLGCGAFCVSATRIDARAIFRAAGDAATGAASPRPRSGVEQSDKACTCVGDCCASRPKSYDEQAGICGRIRPLPKETGYRSDCGAPEEPD
jgi:hypothetical protein